MDLQTNGQDLLQRCGATSKKIGVEINGSLEFEQWLIRFDKRMIGKRWKSKNQAQKKDGFKSYGLLDWVSEIEAQKLKRKD